MAGLHDVRRIALGLPRAYEAMVRDHVKFRVGRIVFASVSPDETLLGFGFPREEREALVTGNPTTFLMPVTSDLRYQWVRLRLAEVDEEPTD
ncbi:MAG: MmcQ/YjbR family DNA-binding protein [Aeromicrobium sp.]